MRGYSVSFDGPLLVSVSEDAVPSPEARQVLVQTQVSAISPGTELLIYRGEWPENLPVDETIPALAGAFHYPLSYGYACVGTVIQVGREVSRDWIDRRVFAFQPHRSHFVSSTEQLIVLPDNLPSEAAAFLPNMETAVSFLMDGRPMIGERVVALGQGVVGLLTTALLSDMPLSALITADRYSLRRDKSIALGAWDSVDPADSGVQERLAKILEIQMETGGADLVYELSGNPAALDLAISLTGFSGRVVVGSWYGAKKSALDLGGRFHRGHIRVSSSQVSRLAPELTGRWTKKRRLRLVLDLLARKRPTDLITHRYHILRAAEAYDVLHQHPEEAIQVMLTYEV